MRRSLVFYVEVSENGCWMTKKETVNDKVASSLVQYYRSQGKRVRLVYGSAAAHAAKETSVRQSDYLTEN